jgi:hypothetical protein
MGLSTGKVGGKYGVVAKDMVGMDRKKNTPGRETQGRGSKRNGPALDGSGRGEAPRFERTPTEKRTPE